MEKRYVAGPDGEGTYVVVNLVDKGNDYNQYIIDLNLTKNMVEKIATALNREYELGYKAAQKDMREAIGIDNSAGHVALGGVVF